MFLASVVVDDPLLAREVECYVTVIHCISIDASIAEADENMPRRRRIKLGPTRKLCNQ